MKMKNVMMSLCITLSLLECASCNGNKVLDNAKDSYDDSLFADVDFVSILDSDSFEVGEICEDPIEPEINYTVGLRIQNLNYSQRIFVSYEIKFDTVINDTIRVKDITRMRMSTYNREIPDSVLKKDSVLQKEVYDRLIHNTYTTKDDIRGKHIFGTAVVLRGK